MRDHDRPTSWGWLVAIALAVWIALTAGFGPQAPKGPPPSGTACQYGVAPDQIHVWIDRLGGWADYRDGYWYDASGSVVGKSSAEDSDVCSYVR